MNNIRKDIRNTDGTIETLVITSSDNYVVNLGKSYKLANYKQKKENKLVSNFKNSILGSDIGVKSEGFSNIAILATIIAVFTICIMYILCRV